MPAAFLTKITFNNYRSYVAGGCRLRPFTLVVGSNNSGKTNFLRLFQDIASTRTGMNLLGPGIAHQKHAREGTGVRLSHSIRVGDNKWRVEESRDRAESDQQWEISGPLPIYRLDPSVISASERTHEHAFVLSTGEGVTRVLDAMKSSTRYEERFNAVRAAFGSCVPEVRSLGIGLVEGEKRFIEVLEHGFDEPVPLSQLSDGSRLILAILTIIYQPNPPEIILLEDIDRGIHPRLYETLVRQMREITRTHGVQIIATTHSPYLLDEFQDEPEAVVIVEKVNGESRLLNMSDRLQEVFGKDGEPETPLGELWFSGAVGGVPKRKLPSLPKP